MLDYVSIPTNFKNINGGQHERYMRLNHVLTGHRGQNGKGFLIIGDNASVHHHLGDVLPKLYL